MSEKPPSKNKLLLSFAPVFESALHEIKNPFMQLLVVLALVLLLVFIAKGNTNPNLSFVLVIVVLVIFAFLAFVLFYAAMRLHYTEKTNELLKKELRDAVRESQKVKRQQVSPPKIQITYIEFDPPGNDVEGEFVKIENLGDASVDITQWVLDDRAGNRFVFPSFILKPKSYVRIWTKSNKNTTTDLYWNHTTSIWNNTGDCAYLRDNQSVLISTCCYGSYAVILPEN